MFSCEYCEIFTNNFFHRTSLVAASFFTHDGYQCILNRISTSKSKKQPEKYWLKCFKPTSLAVFRTYTLICISSFPFPIYSGNSLENKLLCNIFSKLNRIHSKKLIRNDIYFWSMKYIYLMFSCKQRHTLWSGPKPGPGPQFWDDALTFTCLPTIDPQQNIYVEVKKLPENYRLNGST